MRPFPQSLFTASIEILAGKGTGDSKQDEAASCFLKDLGYLSQDGTITDADETPNRLSLLSCAQKLDLFALEVPDAPRMLFIGGRVLPKRFAGLEAYSPSNTAGISTNMVEAFESSVGEGIEYLSQLTPANDTEVAVSAIAANESGQIIGKSSWQHYEHGSQTSSLPSSWLNAVLLTNREKRQVPAQLCLRHPTRRALGMSTGCAAGQTTDHATLSALLELVERDAAALWWEGGCSPRPIALEAIADASLQTLYARAGRRSDTKSTILLDISTDVNIPCVAALSADLDTGENFACGLASRISLSDAIRKAVHEMIQMETGHHLLSAKRRALGDESLNVQDKKQIERDRSLRNIWCTPMVQTVGQPMHYPECSSGVSSALETLLDTFRSQQLDAISVDLTREWLGVPVIKVFAPGLQTYPAKNATPRLFSAKAASGGTRQYTAGISLL